MKILVRATNWVGDAIMSIPALEAVRQRWPDAHIAVLARSWVVDLYRGQPFLDLTIALDAADSNGIGNHSDSIIPELRGEHFDCALLLQNAFHAAWIAWRSGIPERIGYGRDGRGVLLTKSIAVPKAGETPAHESYYYLELLRRIGWIDTLPEVNEIRLRIEPQAIVAAAKKLITAGACPGKMWIAFAPGAAYGSAKCWFPERFAELADGLIADFDADVILFGTASERDIVGRIESRMRHRPVNLTGQTSIGELPALFAACHLFIGNDSGAMHVAAAAGLPVVAVFGPTDPDGTAPVTLQRSLVRQPVSCSPCFLRHCPIDHRCMTRIEVADVRAAAQGWVERLVRA